MSPGQHPVSLGGWKAQAASQGKNVVCGPVFRAFMKVCWALTLM